MKKIFTLLFAIVFSQSIFAQVTTGYYRIQNAKTYRYLYVYDDKGEAKLDGAQVKMDIDAIYLREGLNNAISDPESIIYIEKKGNSFNFSSQGTSVYDILGRYLGLNARNGQYAVGATVSGVTKYLTDKKVTSTKGYGVISTDGDAKFWNVIPVNSSTDNYFAVKPTISANGNKYMSFYASFGYTPCSSDLNVYYVSALRDDAVLLTKIDGVVPVNTPVIIESATEEIENNKLDLTNSISTISDNKLSGVYFNTDNSEATYAVKVHKNQTKGKSSTRVLGVNSNGQLVFTNLFPTPLPANSAYLEVPDTADSELRVYFTPETYDPNSSISSVIEDNSSEGIYDLLGKKVSGNKKLQAGLYIIDGKKTLIR